MQVFVFDNTRLTSTSDFCSVRRVYDVFGRNHITIALIIESINNKGLADHTACQTTPKVYEFLCEDVIKGHVLPLYYAHIHQHPICIRRSTWIDLHTQLIGQAFLPITILLNQLLVLVRIQGHHVSF